MWLRGTSLNRLQKIRRYNSRIRQNMNWSLNSNYSWIFGMPPIPKGFLESQHAAPRSLRWLLRGLLAGFLSTTSIATVIRTEFASRRASDWLLWLTTNPQFHTSIQIPSVTRSLYFSKPEGDRRILLRITGAKKRLREKMAAPSLERNQNGSVRFNGCSSIRDFELLGKLGEGTFG